MLAFTLPLFLACGSDTTPEITSEETQEIPRIVIYSGRGESLVGELFAKMEKDMRASEELPQFDLEVQYGSTSEMATRFLTEGDQSPADIIFAQDSGHLGALAKQGVLETLSPDLLSEVDERFRAKDGTWIGTSGRLRVLVYDSKQLSPEELPKSLKELSDPKWKGKLGWAPTNGSFQAHVSVLRNVWGEEETKAWLEGVKQNEPKSYPKNSPQVKAANEGSLAIGWVNHYYLHRVDSKGRTAINYSFPNEDVGNILMVAGAGIRKGSPNKEAAEMILKALVSKDGQSHFAMNNYEYPTRPNVQTHPDVPDLDLKTVMDIPQEYLIDIGPTRTLLQELSLQ